MDLEKFHLLSWANADSHINKKITFWKGKRNISNDGLEISQ